MSAVTSHLIQGNTLDTVVIDTLLQIFGITMSNVEGIYRQGNFFFEPTEEEKLTIVKLEIAQKPYKITEDNLVALHSTKNLKAGINTDTCRDLHPVSILRLERKLTQWGVMNDATIALYPKAYRIVI